MYAFYSLPTLLVFPLSPPYVDFLSSTSRGQFDVQVNHACVIFRNQIKLKILKGKQRSVLNGNVHNALEHVRFCFFFFFCGKPSMLQLPFWTSEPSFIVALSKPLSREDKCFNSMSSTVEMC